MTDTAELDAMLPPGGILVSDRAFADLRENHCSRCGHEIGRDEWGLLLWPLVQDLMLYYQYCGGCSVAGHA